MKKFVTRFSFIVIVFVIGIQFYQPARNLDNGQVLPTHLIKVYHVPKTVQQTLERSCFDCHSNNTNYPWYSYVQPVRLLLENHIKEGKHDLNFSVFGTYSKRRQESKFKAMAEQIKSGEMPLFSYTLLHRNAKLYAEEKKMLLDWIEKIQDSVAQEF